MPFNRNCSERAFDRWMASLIMSGVAVAGGFATEEVVKIPPESIGLVAAVVVAVVGVGVELV
jgi:hypothetical protein